MQRDSYTQGDAVTLLVTVTYGGRRVTEFLPSNVHKAITSLRKDLSKVTMIQPKNDTIRIPVPGVVRFHWLSTIGSPLQTSLEAKLNPGDGRSIIKKQRKFLKDASILTLELSYEPPLYDPDEFPESHTERSYPIGNGEYADYHGEEPPEYRSRPPSCEPPSRSAPRDHALRPKRTRRGGYKNSKGQSQSAEGPESRKAPEPARDANTPPPPRATMRKLSQSHPLPAKPVSSYTNVPASSSNIPSHPLTPPYTYSDRHHPQTYSYPEDSYHSAAQQYHPSTSRDDRPESICSVAHVENMLLDERDASKHSSLNRDDHQQDPRTTTEFVQLQIENQHLLEQIATLKRKNQNLEIDLESERRSQMNTSAVSPPTPSPSQRQEDTEHWVREQALEQQLEEERIKRMEAEKLLEDIEKECREPFVVPALLHAFMMVRNVGTSVLDSLKAQSGQEIFGLEDEVLGGARDISCKVEEVDDLNLESLKRRRGSEDYEDELESGLDDVDEEPGNFNTRPPPRKRFVPENYVRSEWE